MNAQLGGRRDENLIHYLNNVESRSSSQWFIFPVFYFVSQVSEQKKTCRPKTFSQFQPHYSLLTLGSMHELLEKELLAHLFSQTKPWTWSSNESVTYFDFRCHSTQRQNSNTALPSSEGFQVVNHGVRLGKLIHALAILEAVPALPKQAETSSMSWPSRVISASEASALCQAHGQSTGCEWKSGAPALECILLVVVISTTNRLFAIVQWIVSHPLSSAPKCV